MHQDISTYGNKSIHSTPPQPTNPLNPATKTSAAIFPRSFAKVQRMARIVIRPRWVRVLHVGAFFPESRAAR